MTSLLSVMSEISSQGFKVDENFRLVLVENGGAESSTAKYIPANLNLLCRPFTISSEMTFAGVLASVVSIIDLNIYANHCETLSTYCWYSNYIIFIGVIESLQIKEPIGDVAFGSPRQFIQ